ncbi:MAG: GMC family oxidoreductase, partial [Acidobacteriota bacterium]
MQRLSLPITKIKSHYRVVVIGSGYGGSIAASRLARARQQVCLLERGKERHPGEYPNTEKEVTKEIQVESPYFPDRIGSAASLYRFHTDKDINVFIGCGLGGTSLVNAGVALRAEKRVFEDKRWPEKLRQDLESLELGYQRAEEMLKPKPYPVGLPEPTKLKALEKSANYLKQTTDYNPQQFYTLPICVNFDIKGLNHVGVEQLPCTNCGDCVSGCNYSSKNTLIMNYLPDAVNFGAEIFTQVQVRYIKPNNGKWLVYFQVLDAGRNRFDLQTQFVSADIVILAAGTLGSTEILLRSKNGGLSISDKIGRYFSGNGDVLGFAYNCDEAINGIGLGSQTPNPADPDKNVGPCITGIIDLREQRDLKDSIVIEDAVIPGAIASAVSTVFASTAKIKGIDTDSGVADKLQEKLREIISATTGPYYGAMHNTQTFLVMSHDGGNGLISLEPKSDKVKIDWPLVGKQLNVKKANDAMLQATKPVGGTYLKNPLWSRLLNFDLITVHPLGGCIMADTADKGVVNHKGEVFSESNGENVHSGLYIMDGSIIPTSLGVNPLLTISGLAERSSALIAEDHGWTIDYKQSSISPSPTLENRPGIKFSETMSGYFAEGVTDDYKRGEEIGQTTGSSFRFVLTLTSDDLEDIINSPNHEAIMTGTVEAPKLSSEPLTAVAGIFNIFTQDPTDPNTENIRYRMKLISIEGKTYYFDGIKFIHRSPIDILWNEMTTLYITLYEGDNESGAVIGKGILQVTIEGFKRQLTTIEITNVDEPE